MMTFKPSQEIFSYEAMSNDEVMLKEGSKYRGQGFTITIKGEKIRGIWLFTIRGVTGVHYLSFINLGFGDVRLETGPFFHNKWSYISLNDIHGVEKLEIGKTEISEAKQKDLIKYLFEDFEE